jgi:ElaB/YqjD/DUF883 family membrane-anchored ribosome-binding protein
MTNKHNEDARLDQILRILMEVAEEKKINLKNYVAGLYEDVKKAEHQAADQVKHAAEKVDTRAHEKPWLFVAGAGLVGYLMGRLCHRRHKTK